MPSKFGEDNVNFDCIDMPNLSPEMMRFASQQMNNMSPEQIQNMMRNVSLQKKVFKSDFFRIRWHKTWQE